VGSSIVAIGDSRILRCSIDDRDFRTVLIYDTETAAMEVTDYLPKCLEHGHKAAAAV
jgi:hypothetical protein